MAAQAETPQLKRAQEAFSPAPTGSPSSSTILTPTPVSPRRVKRRSPAPVLARWQHEADVSADGSSAGSPVGSLRAMTPSKTSYESMNKTASPSILVPKDVNATTPEDLADHILNLSITGTTTNIPVGASAAEPTPDSGNREADAATTENKVEALSSEPATDIPASLAQASEDIAAIREAIFQLEEKRHTSAKMADGEMEVAIIHIDGRLESISANVQQIESALARQGTVDGSDAERKQASASVFDFGFANPASSSSGDLQSAFEDLASDWMAIQSEVDTLKKELGDTKYVEHFQTFSKQVTDIMDSLERALTECSTFVTTFKKEGLAAKGSDDEEDEEMRKHKQMRRFEAAKKSFRTKLSYYLPPCEQTFTSFERSLKDRGTSHGAITRQLGELNTRWRALKEKSNKVDRELKRLDRAFTDAEQKNQPSTSTQPATLEVPTSAALPASPLPADSSLPSTPLKPMRDPSRVLSSGAGERFPGPPPASGGLTRSPAGPSSLLLVPSTASRLPSTSTNYTHVFPVSGSADGQRGSAEEPLPRTSGLEGTPRTAAKRMSASPEMLRGSTASPKRRIVGLGPVGSTASQAPSSYRFASSDLGTGTDRNAALGFKTPQPATPSQRARSEAVPRGMDNDAMEMLADRPSSRASAAPPTTPAAGKAAARRLSQIPGPTPRPGSAMSKARSTVGSSAPMTPSANRLSYGGGASRAGMQTPEPVIAARVKNLSVYSKPSSGAPSTSSASNGPGGLATPRRKVLGGPPSRPPVSRSSIPPSPALRVNGRTTPLSASALAKVPHAAPMSMNGTNLSAGERSTSITRPPSVASSSVANFRASRASIIAGNGLLATPASKRNGREGATTPTQSEGGYSSFSQGTGFGGAAGGRTSRAGSIAPTSRFPYRPNPNDALDVAISKITNREGVYLTREDPPLPRGQKTDSGPGKEVRARYRFGDQRSVMTCKLLELHKPARASALVTRQMEEEGIDEKGVQRKVLVKVPSKGFLDLKVWLNSSFAQMDEEEDMGSVSMISYGPDESLGETF
ncbi:hypothetical protein BCV69DRAFT_160156 [Microstroma glucosiphilum]|uniref:GAR domain-containing protein n=1 Tax=Pseudomicrostroma glucosiphilum TaxID=1684307 RepID=A0A316U9N7_9BASI|nr:hypothetical protein BCV69DRAFT_160156 [Pseudomicrostroma glucosiphilum]PWN21926.1 hypothetical protein BCV69DRAFT_160156 [Pseudomicrostroma glucosiphilum]